MKIENLNIFNQVNAKDQNAGSFTRSSQGEEQKSSQVENSFAKLLSTDKKQTQKETPVRRSFEKPQTNRQETYEKANDNETKDYSENSVESNSTGIGQKPIQDRAPISAPRATPVVAKGDAPDEVRPEETRKAAPPAEFDASAGQLNKRIAMQTFLRKMKEQLNVQPEQLMAAFGSLSIEEMTQPPEMNLEKIIQGLSLNEQQKPVAKQLFEDMMKQTAANSMAEYLKSSGQQLSLQVMSQKDVQQRALNQSLTNMNQNFFMTNQKPMPQNQALANQKNAQIPNSNEKSSEQSLAATTSDKGFDISGFFPAAGKMAMTPTMPTGAPVPAPSMSPASVAANQELTEDAANTIVENKGAEKVKAASIETAAPLAAGQPVTPELLSTLMPQMKAAGASSMFTNADQDSDEDDVAVEAPVAKDLSSLDQQQIEKLKAALLAQASNSNKDKSESPKDGSASNPELNIQPQTGMQKPVSFEKAFAAMTAGKHITPEQASGNVKELINQAQFMIKKGGGEMKVRLNPEGLGEVAMKVNVHDGQVKVEMITETGEAKSLIEKGLGDLKATLATHKLNVDQIKVDLAHNTAKDYQQQQDQAHRHQAQQFMEEFRHNNQQWRQSFYDVPGAKAYKSQTSDEAENSYLAPQSTRKSAASRRLDLVA